MWQEVILNGIFGEDEFLSSHVIDRLYNQVTEPASATSSCQYNNEEGTSAGFMEVSPEIIRLFPTAGGRKDGKKQDPDRHATEDWYWKPESWKG